jgi:ribosomal-protein-alanine N-acetyltransferase
MLLATERLLLTPWRPEHWPDLEPLATDPEVMRYITGGVPWTAERIQEFVNRQSACFAERGFCNWRIHLAATNSFAGFCGLQPFDELGEIEIGWWLAPAYWGKGYATEAARAALRDAFHRCSLERIISVAMPDNRASLHVMEKIGMRFSQNFVRRGFPVVVYSITRPVK